MSKLDFDREEADSILRHFAELEDPRCEINRRHALGDMIVICVLAVLAGAGGPAAIREWAQSNAEWLKRRLALPGGVPSRDTIRRLLSLLKPSAFQKCFQSWVAGMRSAEARGEREIIAIDGKALRRSHDRAKGLGPLFLVSAWAAEAGVSLGQLATAEKSNEIAAIPELLREIDVGGAVVTIDAAGRQRDTAKLILQGDGDYVLALKGNQGTLHEDVVQYMIEQAERGYAGVAAGTHKETVEGRGRRAELIYHQLPVPGAIAKKHGWPGLKTLGAAIRISGQGGEQSSEARYYIKLGDIARSCGREFFRRRLGLVGFRRGRERLGSRRAAALNH